jgi:hypothetical protein
VTPIPTPTVELTATEKEWVARKWRLIRASQQKADAANKTWNEINDAINHKHAREDARRSERGDFPLTDLMKAQAKGASLPLKDAVDTGNWHSRNAERHLLDLQVFLEMKKMGLM